MKIGFFGLGNMGAPIALNLVGAGHELIVYNRTASKTAEIVSRGARAAASPAEACRADVVMSMLADDHAVEDIFFQQNLLPEIRGVHISLSTVSVDLSKRLAAAHAAAGAGYVASPVFGRPEAAAAAKLVVAAAGAPEAIAKVRPLLEAIGRKLVVVGRDPWLANIVKLSGNLMLAVMLETMGEVFALLQKSGVDRSQFLDIINTLFQSPVYQNYGSAIIEERFSPAGFSLKLGLKDVRLVLAAAEGQATPLPLASLCRDQFLTALAKGRGDLDWSAVATVAADNAGVKLTPG